MKNKVFITFSGLILLATAGVGQSYKWKDTLASGDLSHMYLNIEIPQGDVQMKSSEVCGMSFTQLSTPDSQIRHQIHTQTNEHGNHLRKLVLAYQPNPVARQAMPANTLRMAEQISDLKLFGEVGSLNSEYLQDPSMSTDLYMNLGTGVSMLDFSGLSLKNVSINSAFSDVLISYSDSNLLRMNEMDIHAAKANIKVEHAELANAELITIQNDMGELEFLLGDLKPAQSTIYLQLGVGSCSLIVSEKQPVHLILKSGLFSTVEVGTSFQEQEKGVYTNAAYQALPNKKKATRIICNIDMGSVSVEGKE